jgi:hypothetical protein
MRRFLSCIFLLSLAAAPLWPPAATAQLPGSDKPLMLLMRSGPGAIVLPTGKNWQLNSLDSFDNGLRPVALYKWGDGAIGVSFILFPNASGEPTSQGCRKNAIGGIVSRLGNAISNRVDAEEKTAAGAELATTSYRIKMDPVAPGRFQDNLFGFAGNEKTCAEIHISRVRETPNADETMKARFGDFHFDLAYQPTALDYFRLANLMWKTMPGTGAPYYQSALDAMTRDDRYKTLRRVATDHLVMSLGIGGDVKGSRAVAENAIMADPDYPMNYYNLACSDAEQGNAALAKIHLQQAFDRRAHVLPGESMPDPTRDNSIRKLKKDKAFWDFVQTLPKN